MDRVCCCCGNQRHCFFRCTEQLPGTPLKLAWSEGGEGQPGAPPEAHDSAEQEGIAAVHDVHALEEVPAAGEDKGLRRGRQAAVLLNA